jgi:hypothetical protein
MDAQDIEAIEREAARLLAQEGWQEAPEQDEEEPI